MKEVNWKEAFGISLLIVGMLALFLGLLMTLPILLVIISSGIGLIVILAILVKLVSKVIMKCGL